MAATYTFPVGLLCLLVMFQAVLGDHEKAAFPAKCANCKKHEISPRSVSSCGSTPRNCEAWRVLGVPRMRSYMIDPDGEGGVRPFQVKCDMTVEPAVDIVIHNYPSRTEVKDAPEFPNGKYVAVVYRDAKMDQLVALMNIDGDCSQSLNYECHNAVISYKGVMHTTWLSRTGERMRYWPGGPADGYGCACNIHKTCAGGPAEACNCEKNDNVWRTDGGNVTDKTSLPISGMIFADTNEQGERGFYTLGPLKCKGKKKQDENFDVHFCDADNYKGLGHWILPAKVVADHSYNPDCIAISTFDPANYGSYDLTVDVLMARKHKNHVAGGVIYNVMDEINYDLLIIRPLNVADCYEYGFVKNGLYTKIEKDHCRHGGPPNFYTWFQLKVEMRQNGAVSFRLNGGFVASGRAHFRAFRRGGALTHNKVQSLLLFKNYNLRPLCD